MDYLNVVNELNYMTQIVIMLYEDPNKVFKMDKYLQKQLILSYVLMHKPIQSLSFRNFLRKNVFT